MDLYSRMISFLKVLLPLAALAILATLFMLSRSDDTIAKIPFAEDEIADRTRNQQVTSPFFSGTTPKGDEIIITASLARPGGPNVPAEAVNLSGRIKMADGVRMTLESDTGSFDITTDMAKFLGNVRITTSTGFLILTEELNAALNDVSGSTPGSIEGSGPLGHFTAGQMQIEAENGDGPVHMVFKNGVKLIYDPKQTER